VSKDWFLLPSLAAEVPPQVHSALKITTKDTLLEAKSHLRWLPQTLVQFFNRLTSSGSPARAAAELAQIALAAPYSVTLFFQPCYPALNFFFFFFSFQCLRAVMQRAMTDSSLHAPLAAALAHLRGWVTCARTGCPGSVAVADAAALLFALRLEEEDAEGKADNMLRFLGMLVAGSLACARDAMHTCVLPMLAAFPAAAHRLLDTLLSTSQLTRPDSQAVAAILCGALRDPAPGADLACLVCQHQLIKKESGAQSAFAAISFSSKARFLSVPPQDTFPRGMSRGFPW
jgi:hypothetical protein